MNRARESRPGIHPQAAEAFAGANQILAEFEVRGVVRLDLRAREVGPVADDSLMARQVQMLVYAPHGADVVVQVAAGQFVPSLAVAYLRSEGSHLGSVTVESSDPATVRQWVRALRGEEPTSW